MSDLELVALNITAEYMSINSELQLFRCISGTHLEGKVERSVYNKRRRKLFPYIEKIRETLSSKFSDFTNVFIVDSTPIEICKISRANRSAICSTLNQHQLCKNISGFSNKNSIENNFFYDDSIPQFFRLQEKFKQIKN